MATRYFANPQYLSTPRQASDAGSRFQELTARYPNLSEQEHAEMINLFPYMRTRDFASLSLDDGLSDKYAAFRRDNAEQLSAPVAALMWSLLAPVALAIGALGGPWADPNARPDRLNDETRCVLA